MTLERDRERDHEDYYLKMPLEFHLFIISLPAYDRKGAAHDLEELLISFQQINL